jgi:hypothetical protein
LDVIYHCKVLWTFGWDRPILIWYHVSFSMVLVPQLQL